MDATATKPRLARGLSALIGDAGHDELPANRLPVGDVKQNPYQPRKRFDDDELASLTASVKNHGVLQPLVVRRSVDDNDDNRWWWWKRRRRIRTWQQ